MIKIIRMKIRQTDGGGLFHDSRSDVNTLMQVCNTLIEKVNELVDKVNELEKNQLTRNT